MHAQWKAALLVLTLIGASVGLTACAKYPVVSDVRASSPSASPATPER